ncbi:hypothetical protein WJ98_19480 [Burkholderia ubonensis]|nr:hypothetical protein WJ98_19480 [Burkholderia ubonensis]
MRGQLVPLARLAVPHPLSGAQGANRTPAFPYIAAQHDLAAVRAHLNRYASQGATQRAYRRELERFLQVGDRRARHRAVVAAGRGLRRVQGVSRRASRRVLRAAGVCASGRRRPFAPGGLSLESQLYACARCARRSSGWSGCATWPAIPWAAVTDP